ncbi:MAG: T9SS type A sorting domain-containing protein [Candidatus Cloacimonetes bacterium]|nr:T9SS type A sorting domain-containing protein [Candidatus Cloacimonadota bacterium]
MKYSKIVLVSIISLLILVSRSFCVCVGNEQGACVGNDPATCGITKLVVGSNLSSTNDEDKGRTSNKRYPVSFTHNGASASFTVSPITQDKDAGLSITESTCDGNVVVFFNSAGAKTVSLKVHQSGVTTERTLNSSNNFKVIYDNVAPEITLTEVFIGPDASGVRNTFSAGSTFFTSDEVTVRARVVDLDPAVAADQVGAQVIGGLREVGQIIPQTAAGNGLFEFPLGLAVEPDGTYNMEVAGVDSITGLFPDGSRANTSKGVSFIVIKDSEPPVVTKLEIIINPTSENRKTVGLPNVFVPAGTFKVRATFSEDMGAAPNLLVSAQGSGFGEVSPPTFGLIDTTLFPASRKVIEYNYTPLNNIENLGALNIGFSDNGRDMSGNALDLARGAMAGSSTIDGGSVIERAAVLDLVPPDLKRLVPGDQGSIQSIPKNGKKLPKQGFPSEITIIVGDYNFAEGSIPSESEDELFKTNNASGVDFTRLLDAGAAEDAKGIKVEVLNPEGEAIVGTLSTKPPNGLVYLFSDLVKIFPPNGFAPAGTYTVRVSMVDKVGNDSVETFFFNIDATDVDPKTIEVSLLPEKPPLGFEADTGNPLHVNPLDGIIVPDNPALVDLALVKSVRELASFKVCSTDPTINLTQTEVTMKARLNGPDTVAKTMTITGAVNINDVDNTCGLPGAFSFDVLRNQLKAFPNLNFDFPNPPTVGTGVLPGARDPRFGRFDGPYQVEVIGVDDAGNISDPIVKEFLLDTTPPLTWDTFPPLNGKINSPIRHVSAEIKDPHPPRLHTFDTDAKLNFGSGISQTHSSMKLFLDSPYRENSLNPDLFKGSERELSSFLTYTHRPNAVDPDAAGYNPKDDAYKVLLEFTNLGSKVESLPEDGSADGIYRMQVVPVDNSGNSVQAAIDGKSGFQPSQDATEITTETRKDFVFLLDSIAPVMNFKEINGEQPKKLQISGDNFKVEGSVQDLSARLDEPTKGGSGVSRVEYRLVLLTESGALVPGVEVGGRLRKNPIISGEAHLSPIVDVANDPTVSLTKPMDPTTYKEITLVNREFTINALLPPFNDIIKGGDAEGAGVTNYFLEITGFDHSGNEVKKSLSVIMNFGKLASPELMNPVFGSYSNKTSFNFEFKAVDSATDYVLGISRPNGTTTTQIVRPNPNSDIVNELILLSEKGEYFWWVTARDSVGNLGLQTIRQPFYLDLDRPKVSQVFWSDSTPGSENGKLTLGEFQLSIRFSEELEQAPLVTYKPLAESIESQVVVTQAMNDGIWKGRVVVPRDANYEWDGTATIDISKAKDKSGNEMFTDRKNTFEIETGPDYEIRLFENPVSAGEIVLVLKASESLSEDPVVYEATGVERMSDDVIRIKDKSYSTVFKVPNNFSGIASFKITGKDLESNASTRVITFPIATVSPVNASILKTRNTRLYVPENTVSKSISIGLLPQRQFAQGPNEDSFNEMKKVKELDSLYPSNVKLNNDLGLSITLDEPLKDKQGLFLKSSDGVQFLSASRSRVLTANIDKMGQLLIYEDSSAPMIGWSDQENISLQSRGDKLHVTIEDIGSGIDEKSLFILIDERPVTWSRLSDVLFEVNVPELSEGSHNLEIQVQDKVRNLSVSKALATVNSVLKLKVSAFPNPARSFAKIQYDLNVGVSYMKLSIYDTSGALVYHTNSVSDFLLNTNAGRHAFEWDLVSSRGNDVKNGVYFVKISANDLSGNLHKSTIKIAVLK